MVSNQKDLRIKLNIEVALGIGLILILHIPVFILGERSYVLVHDNLDSEFVYLHILKISRNLFGFSGSSPVYNIFNGLSRGYFHSEFSFIRVLFYFLPSFLAYVANSMIIRSIGFLGIYLLEKDYLPSNNGRISVFIIAATFALLPLYSLYGLSIIGQPILFWAFLNLRARRRIVLSLILIAIFPFYSHFSFVAPFVLSSIFIYAMYNNILLKKKVSHFFWIGIAILFLSFIIANINAIFLYILGDEISHREDWINYTPSFLAMIKSAGKTIIYGQYHSATLNSIPVIFLLICAVCRKIQKCYPALGLMIIIVAISCFDAFYNVISVPLQGNFHLLTSFQFNRFTVLVPFFFTLILLLLNQTDLLSKIMIYSAVIVFSILSLYNNSELKFNWSKLILPNTTKYFVSFESFYSKNLFGQIDSYINRPKDSYRVVSLGIHPSIAQFNGFYTLDSYHNNYPLSYKRNFRLIIEGELNKNRSIKEYFDHWGSRCYLFSAELKELCYLDCKKNTNMGVNNLSIDMKKLKQMGAEYIFSAVPVYNADSLNMQLERIFEDDVSSYKIYLYKL